MTEITEEMRRDVEPEVAILILADDWVLPRWALYLKKLFIPCPATINMIKWSPRSDELQMQVEEIVEEENEFTHILIMDDRTFPSQEALQNLISFQYPIMSAYYAANNKEPAAWELTEDNDLRQLNKYEVDKDVVYVDIVDLGFLLIDIRVFNNIESPWFLWRCNNRTLDEDYKFDGVNKYFMIKAKKEGYVPAIHRTTKADRLTE